MPPRVERDSAKLPSIGEHVKRQPGSKVGVVKGPPEKVALSLLSLLVPQ